MSTNDAVKWQAYPSWNQFAWLHCVSLIAGLRGLFFLRFNMVGGGVWLGGAVVLLVCAACLRRWAQYLFTSTRVVVRNGYTGRDIQAIMLDDIGEITLKQGPIALCLGIGTIVIRSFSGDRVLSLRGVNDPEIIKTRIEALRPRTTRC